MLQWMKQRSTIAQTARELYGSSVTQARQQWFYGVAGVPDTLEGRFEMIGLHVFLLVERLQREGEHGTRIGQSLIETMFTALDDDMRELGVGDMTVPKKVHKAAAAFYGRCKAYSDALKAEPGALEIALHRNVLGAQSSQSADALAGYVRATVHHLDGKSFADLRQHSPWPTGEVIAFNQ
jgi:cytochrome b pre-mRNA-processing protein 3